MRAAWSCDSALPSRASFVKIRGRYSIRREVPRRILHKDQKIRGCATLTVLKLELFDRRSCTSPTTTMQLHAEQFAVGVLCFSALCTLSLMSRRVRSAFVAGKFAGADPCLTGACLLSLPPCLRHANL
jgi:hypothetical protein